MPGATTTTALRALSGLLLLAARVDAFAVPPSDGLRRAFAPPPLPASPVADASPTPRPLSDVTRPEGAPSRWEVHKFGGASLATADLYRTVGDLLISESAGGRPDAPGRVPTLAVVSARGGMTDLLVKVVDSALVDFDRANVALEEAVESQIALLRELAPPEFSDPIEARFRADARDVSSVVQSLRMLNTVPAVTMEVVSGFGEIWSAQTLYAYLLTKGVPCDWIDARDVLVVKSDSSGLGEKGEASTGGVTPLYEETMSNLSRWWNSRSFLDLDYSKNSPVVIVTGFVAKTADGVPTTLKRSGSDYSATIFAKLVDAGRVTMWKNTDGVYTADPRRVPEAFPMESLKYDEAMELAYFGAQVLHPSAMEPCIDKGIPVYVRNIFNPAFKGTVIRGRSATLKDTYGETIVNWRSKSGVVPIKGITSVDKTALVTLEGASMGGAYVAERFMGAMNDSNINVLIITQASSESSITVAVPENEGARALAALEDAFELELSRSTISSVSVASGMAVIAIVGEGMALTSGVSSTFMTSLSRANINIRLIAQGSSERQIAVVVNGADATRALRAAHMAFTLSETAASVALLGCTGTIGSCLAGQLESQKRTLKDDVGVAMCVNVAASSERMAVGDDSRGLKLDDVSSLLNDPKKSVPFDLDHVTKYMEADVNPLRVIVDCTNSEDVSEYYERWLASGINVICSSKKVAAGDLARYRRVQDSLKTGAAAWQYESSVGSALPVCTTLKDLFETGDAVLRVGGCVSGTMAFVLSALSDDVPFSEAVGRCVREKIAENDFREDLGGRDTAEKVVVLARLLGLDVGLDDVEVESLLPEGCVDKAYPDDWDERNREMLRDVEEMDAPMLRRLEAAEAEGKVLRYKFLIDVETARCRCSLEAVSKDDPLFRLRLNENLVAFHTQRYRTSPLIIKGAAAGPDLAASGIFADLLRLTRAYSANQG